MRLLWVIPGYYGLFRVIMGYSGLSWGFVVPTMLAQGKQN